MRTASLLVAVTLVSFACTRDRRCGDPALRYDESLGRCTCREGVEVPEAGTCVPEPDVVDAAPVCSPSECRAVPFARAIGCTAGACSIVECEESRRDCDRDYATGCEALLGTVEHCAGCGDACGWRCGDAGCNDASRLRAGYNHTCALRDDGTAWCWGANDTGQLGDGSATARFVPVPVLGASRFVDLAVGAGHSCGARRDGTVACWGDNGRLQLGARGLGESREPVMVSFVAGAAQVVAGESHSCALTARGEIYCWGAIDAGQVGAGVAREGDTLDASRVSLPSDAVDLACGTDHTCAVLSDGRVFCWGLNHLGQLGDGTRTTAPSPVEVTGMSSARSIAAGASHTCVLVDDGSVWCWGANVTGQVSAAPGADVLSPMRVLSLPRVRTIAAGFGFSCGVADDERLWCWGTGGLSGVRFDGIQAVEVDGAPIRARSVAGGGAHLCVIDVGSRPLCWGNNDSGQLGTGDFESRGSPTAVVAPDR